ncbi:MAG: hypothetical protein HQK49_17485 [Oligoflexia bacterium]|nr:hypothetical protein [Oligoflexia bacterium]
MNGIFKSFFLFKILITLFLFSQAWATIPTHCENYELARPDILSYKTSKSDTTLAECKPPLVFKRGHLELTAMLFALYPDREIYFLARDAELFYDTAKFLSHKLNMDFSSRIHLLNISSRNVGSGDLTKYLGLHGIDESKLKNGKKFLFVDTGFVGTIPKKIATKFKSNVNEKNWHTQLVWSYNKKHPAFRSFLLEEDSSFPNCSMNASSGSKYEEIPKFTDTSIDFEYDDDEKRIVPISIKVKEERKERDNGDVISKKEAICYQKTLIQYLEKKENLELFKSRYQKWSKLYTLAQQKKKDELIKVIHEIFTDKMDNENIFDKTMVLDFLDILDTNLPELKSGLNIDWSKDLKFLSTRMELQANDQDQRYYTEITSNKDALLKRYPDWKEMNIIDDPSKVSDKNFPELLKAVDVVLDRDWDTKVIKILGQNLIKEENKTSKKILIESMKKIINRGVYETLTKFVSEFFSNKQTLTYPELMTAIIKNKHASTEYLLRGVVNSHEHWKEYFKSILNNQEISLESVREKCPLVEK